MNTRLDPTALLPTLADIEAAAEVVYRDFAATPQYRWGLLSQRLGTDCWLKHENHTPVGAFKIRGGLTYFDQLAQRGALPSEVISATRGNHGQSMGWAARRHGVACTIVVPRGNSVEKNAAMRALGVTLIEHGDDFQEAREHAIQLAAQRGAHMVPSFHPDLLRGVSTYWWEFLRAVPQLDVVYVPIGQGSGACSAIAAKLALRHPVRVVGVVSSHATTYADSLAAGSVIEAPVTTQLADGMACRVADPEALAVMAPHIDHIVQVSDAEVAAAMRALFTDTHNVAEGAGAAALAAALQERDQLQGLHVGLALTGGRPLFWPQSAAWDPSTSCAPARPRLAQMTMTCSARAGANRPCAWANTGERGGWRSTPSSPARCAATRKRWKALPKACRPCPKCFNCRASTNTTAMHSSRPSTRSRWAKPIRPSCTARTFASCATRWRSGWRASSARRACRRGTNFLLACALRSTMCATTTRATTCCW